ncbi:hypothetical protein BPAE_0210g00010 [Botrytis paeoniae]|uniref:Uncharacterized protein n=1 Tax=Botrytis paeoniae TaxID=278948 RepID=A0A4Z1FAX4_9HELO|nr:hypothetical protein BPAE_0210g00010 [Botrytis paeoniae]
MEDPTDTALLFKQIKEKVTRDGDDQGEVTEELFESELKVLRKRLRIKKLEDTPLEHEIRTANSICAYFYTAKELMEVWKAKQAAPPIVSGTLIAGIPLHDWLALKKGDPETAKELMDDWKAEQAALKAAALTEKNSEEAKVNSKSAAKKELKD